MTEVRSSEADASRFRVRALVVGLVVMSLGNQLERAAILTNEKFRGVRTVLADPPAYLTNKLLSTDRTEALCFDGMHARSRAMRQVFERIRLAAGVDTTVLIIGESGTGKELVARSIHGRSQRQHGPFMALHTGAIPQDLIASELFGHEKGAFTGAIDRKQGKFELAETGTLFLDEVSTMDDRTQVGLLRVLETFRYTRVGGRRERLANVRIVAASNRDLESLVRSHRFREDLLYRLNVFPIRLPALRDRVDLTNRMLREHALPLGWVDVKVCAVDAVWSGLKLVVRQALR